MGYIHCCGGIHSAKTFVLLPEEDFLFAQADFLEECPVCNHTVLQLTRIDKENNVSVCRKVNQKARTFFDKLKKSILYEKDSLKYVTRPMSKFYLGYNEFGVKKKCYSNLSSLKLGLFENKIFLAQNNLKLNRTLS